MPGERHAQGQQRMSDTLQPPPSAETPANEEARDVNAPDEATPQPAWPAWPAEATEASDAGPARVPILSGAPAEPVQPVAEQPPAEQRLPVPAPPHRYPQPYPQPYPPQRSTQTALAEQSTAVAEPQPMPRPDLYAPPPPPPQSRFWRAVKWPIRQAIKGIYLLFSAAGRHKVVTAIILGTVLLLSGAGVVLYRALHPDTIDAHITTQANLPPLPSSVKHWIEGYHTYNGQEVWDSLSATRQQQEAQQGVSASALQTQLSQAKAENVSFESFLYAGGFVGADGVGHYMIEMKLTSSGQEQVANLYFITEPGGKILAVVDATPQQSSSASGQ
jgi:hypothetical protein